LARYSYGYQLQTHPELSGKFAWGGAFGTQIPSGGPPDLMHFDLGGTRGHWTQSQLPNLGPLYPRASADRGVVDAKSSHTVKVEGSGTLTANINAPPGTDVNVGGKGLFKKTEVNRQVQMTPAKPGAGFSAPVAGF
jgi:hypothetical protein